MLMLGRISTLELLISIVLVVSVKEISSGTSRKYSQLLASLDYFHSKDNNSPYVIQIQDHQMPPAEANSSLSVEVDTKVVLFCPPVQTILTLVAWIILLRDELPCTKVYRTDKNIVEGNCTDPRITWPFRPDQNPALQIEPVSVTHDGNYTCDMATQEGNFLHRYYLQVQVPPAVTLSQDKNRTAVCKAAAGKPAAQISWTPGGDCVTEEETLGNGTVTIQSTCHWAERNVSAVSCSVFHLTGNKILSLELSGGPRTQGNVVSLLLIALCVKSCLLLFILVIMGFIHLLSED